MENKKLALILFVVNPQKHSGLIQQLKETLAQEYQGTATLEVIDVLELPEKALQYKVYATPMLVRTLPEPLMKVLMDISGVKDVLISLQHPQGNVLF